MDGFWLVLIVFIICCTISDCVEYIVDSKHKEDESEK